MPSCTSPKIAPVCTFDNLEALESGSAREFISTETIGASEDEYRTCVLTRPTKQFFQLHDQQTGAHLLSATKLGEEFRVTSYEASSSPRAKKPLDRDASTVRRSCAVLERVAERKGASVSYRLRLCVGGQSAASAIDPPVIEVFPSAFRPKQHPASLIRKLRVELPPPTVDAVPHYVHDFEKLRCSTSSNSSAPSSNSSSPRDVARPLRIRNKLPVWRNGCLTMKFSRGRVKCTSSKNFQLFHDAALDAAGAVATEEAVFQLGKLKPKTFSCDFKSPLSPLQAFAIALAAFDSKNDEPRSAQQ